MRRLFTAIILTGIFLFASTVHAEIKIYDGYGESFTSPIENPDFAKLRAKDAALQDAKNKASIDLMSMSLSRNATLTAEEMFAIINNNIKEVSGTDYETEIIEHSEKTSVIIFKARVKISVDTDGISNWIEMAQENKEALLRRNKIEQTLTAEDRQKVEELRRRAQNAITQEELAQIKDEFEQINNNYLGVQKYIAANEIYSQGKFAEDVKLYDKAIQLHPNLEYAYNNRGNAYFNLRNYNAAIADYNKALNLNPNDSLAYNNRGNAYTVFKNYKAALADYDKALAINPNYFYAYNGRGNAYVYLGNYEQAIQNFNKALELAPNYANAYVNRGNAYYALKN